MIDDAGPDDAEDNTIVVESPPLVTDSDPNVPRSGSKIERVVELLRRADGATLAELVEATGWLPHTTRAALTGLRKKGDIIERYKRDDATCYRITSAA